MSLWPGGRGLMVARNEQIPNNATERDEYGGITTLASESRIQRREEVGISLFPYEWE